MATARTKAETSLLALETFPRVMGYVGCALRREAPVDQQSHFHVLRELTGGDRSLSELAGIASVRLPTMSRTVDALVRHGWVKRYHAAGDRRTLHVKITTAVDEALAATEQLAVERMNVLLDRVDAATLEQLAHGVAGLARAMEQMERVDESA